MDLRSDQLRSQGSGRAPAASATCVASRYRGKTYPQILVVGRCSSPSVINAGFRPVQAVPMRARQRTVQALNVPRRNRADTRARHAASAGGRHRAIGLLHERTVRDAHDLVTQLQGASTSRVAGAGAHRDWNPYEARRKCARRPRAHTALMVPPGWSSSGAEQMRRREGRSLVDGLKDRTNLPRLAVLPVGR
jgi:hypothetical protein